MVGAKTTLITRQEKKVLGGKISTIFESAELDG
jgi:hypothetical protein